MHTVRRATPDSEAVGSSEDERPWPSSTSFGSLPRKENSVPGLPGGIWSNQRRGSFKMSEAAHRNVAREVRLGAANAHSSLRTANTPSPSTSEGTASLPFAIPLQPTPKAHRSLSHSQGQREPPQNSNLIFGVGSGAQALPLGLLTEEHDDESDSELGGVLTHTVSQPPIGSLQRASTCHTTYDHLYSVNNSRGQVDEQGIGQSGARLGRGLEAAFANLAFDAPQRRSQWQSHLGWDDLPVVNESRRHSLADIPTRRGSLAGDELPYDQMGSCFSTRKQPSYNPAPSLRNDTSASFHSDFSRQTGSGGGQESHALTHDDEGVRNPRDMVRFNDDEHGYNIPAPYKVPFVRIDPDELTDDTIRRERQSTFLRSTPFGNPGGGRGGGDAMRPRKLLFVVSFKCSRVEVFFLLDNTGLDIREGDIVIVEADRGQDLGTVQHANVTPDEAKLYKRKYAEEQYKWLMMFSRNNEPSNVNPNAQLYGESSATGTARGNNMLANAPSTMMGLPRENFNNLKPKAIKRLASAHEIKMLGEKEGNEAKAKRTCQQKVAHLHLQMEILDAEWQWDFQKLIFYYYADHYINFKDLITELYRIYKTRIWLSAVNPASFSQHAQGQLPTALGPGALAGGPGADDRSYTMAYGADADPYGAVRPYNIGYDTYAANHHRVPGAENCFPQAGGRVAGAGGLHGTVDQGQAPVNFRAATNNNALPSVEPGASQTGQATDYNFYYDRSGNNAHHMPYTPFENAPNPITANTQMPYNQYAQFFQATNLQQFGQVTPSSTSPWNSTPYTPTHTTASRQAQVPLPIGTRPSTDARFHNIRLGTRFDPLG
ncbi:hypothetical protein LTR08_007584 [Meristemomyces frigidus]|nr:hypothetical protein LTR08_007584 [Meristemomyces frigidus]